MLAKNSSMTRECAVFTIVQNESFFLPVWLQHYSKTFEAKDIYVLNHNSVGESAQQIEQIRDTRMATVVDVHYDLVFSHAWLASTVNRFLAFLLQSYKKVLFTEVDELVTVRAGSEYANLRDYIERFQGPIARTTGYNVYHFPALGELPIDPTKPMLHQRGYWVPCASECKVTGRFTYWYNKPILVSIPVQWEDGFHYVLEHEPIPADPDLLLVHLHGIDVNVIQWRRTAKDMAKLDPYRGEDFHNRPMKQEVMDMSMRVLPPPDAQRIPADQKNII